MSLEQQCLDFFSNFVFHRNIYIAYSGGIDSSFLLYLSSKFFNKNYFSIKALHVNHGYTSSSYCWTIFCKKVCDNYNIPLVVFNSKFEKKKNIEQEFRFIRFNFFFNFIFKNSTLLLAHNKDDFLETMFLRLFRGSSLHSIFGIHYSSKLGRLNIIRPLVNVSKDDIKKFVHLNNISHVSDFSNFNLKFNRNYIRYNILPLVIIKWPNFDKVIIKSFTLSNNFCSYFYFRHLYFFRSNGFNLDCLNVNYLFLVPYFFRCELIKSWIKFNNFKTPVYSQFKELDKLLYSNNQSIGFIVINNYLIKKKKQYLFIENVCFFNNSKLISIHLKKKYIYYFYFEKLLLRKIKIFYIKNFFLIKYFNLNFFILGLFYYKKKITTCFLFKVLY